MPPLKKAKPKPVAAKPAPAPRKPKTQPVVIDWQGKLKDIPTEALEVVLASRKVTPADIVDLLCYGHSCLTPEEVTQAMIDRAYRQAAERTRLKMHENNSRLAEQGATVIPNGKGGHKIRLLGMIGHDPDDPEFEYARQALTLLQAGPGMTLAKLEQKDRLRELAKRPREPQDRPGRPVHAHGEAPAAKKPVPASPGRSQVGSQAPRAPKTPGEPSAKETVYKLWVKKTQETKLLESVKDRVQSSTVRGWIKAWQRGQNLPACAR